MLLPIGRRMLSRVDCIRYDQFSLSPNFYDNPFPLSIFDEIRQIRIEWLVAFIESSYYLFLMSFFGRDSASEYRGNIGLYRIVIVLSCYLTRQ